MTAVEFKNKIDSIIFAETPEMQSKLLKKLYKTMIQKKETQQELHICKYCGVETTQSDDECYAKPKQETLEETGKRVSELVDAMDSNMEMFSITNQIDELGYAVSNMRDIIHEIVKILDVK
jgi:hypothetical protein